MAIERKQFAEKIEKKKLDKVETKKVKRSFKPEALPDAIVDGKLIATVGSEIIVERFRNGKNAYHVCTVKEIADDGLIRTWDETIHQCFDFTVTDRPKVVKLMV